VIRAVNLSGKKWTADRLRARLHVGLLAAALTVPAAARADTEIAPPVTPSAHAERTAALQAVLDGCIARTGLCDSIAVGPDETVLLDGRTASRIRLEWLRAGLRRLGTESGPARQALAADLSTRLTRLGHDPGAVEQVRIQQAGAQVSQVLATAEFKPEREPNWLERKWNGFLQWLFGLLSRSVDAVSNTPSWVRFFFEVLLFLVPVLLLLLWLLRQVREDRLRPSTEADPRRQAADTPSAEWLAVAEELARQRQWRGAIHAMYWATIARLESRKLWRANRTRTPREHIALLEPGSAARAALIEQTRLFELTWYGQREATEGDFRHATQLSSEAEKQ
jgi:hypothetical protein